jgi:hypothetical protein
MFGTGGDAIPMYNAGGYKYYPDEKDLKRLEIVPTDENKQILGFNCKKYTYKKIFGEVWITGACILQDIMPQVIRVVSVVT